jgi:hypothetical protein
MPPLLFGVPPSPFGGILDVKSFYSMVYSHDAAVKYR